MRTRKSGVEYIKKRQFESIEQGVPLTPSVVRVAEKVEKASETSMLRGALSTHRPPYPPLDFRRNARMARGDWPRSGLHTHFPVNHHSGEPPLFRAASPGAFLRRHDVHPSLF
jgi:hypothetical protein